MKKIISNIAFILFCISFVCGCGADKNVESSYVGENVSTEETENELGSVEINVTYDNGGSGDFQAINELINKVTSEEEREKPATLPQVDYKEKENNNEDFSMVPSLAELEGAWAGYLFVPIDGAVYRYYSADSSTDASSIGDMIFETVETTEFGETLHWKVYKLDDYPNYWKLYAAADEYPNDGIYYEYAPSEAISYTVVKEAKEQGFVIVKNNKSVEENREIWDAFLKKVEVGEPASVCIGYRYIEEAHNMTPQLAEATKEDNGSFFMEELTYDGRQFVLAPVNQIDGAFVQCEIPGYNSPTVTYPYLMHFRGTDRVDQTIMYDKYALTRRTDVTWDDLDLAALLCLQDEDMFYIDVISEYCSIQ